MKKGRYFRTLACMGVGVFILATSAFANYEHANGYNLYKNGLKNFIYVENFSMEGSMAMEYNGDPIETAEIVYQYDRNGYTSQYAKTSAPDDYADEEWIQDGQRITSYNGMTYSVYNAYDKGFNDVLLSASEEDKKIMEKVINFMELLGDTMVGDLKNNFVLVSSDDNLKTYQIKLQEQQIPPLVNSGIGLMFSAYNYNSDYTYDVRFEDDGDFTSSQWMDYYQQGWDLLDSKGSGVAYIRKDGSIEYFATNDAYYEAVGMNTGEFSESLFRRQMGEDPYVESANCYVTFDNNGQILENRIDGTLTGKDAGGNKHSYTLRMDFQFHDYGTTKIDPARTDQMTIDNKDDKEYWYNEEVILPEEAVDAGNPDDMVENSSPIDEAGQEV